MLGNFSVEAGFDKYIGHTLSVSHNQYQSSTISFKSDLELELAISVLSDYRKSLNGEKN